MKLHTTILSVSTLTIGAVLSLGLISANTSTMPEVQANPTAATVEHTADTFNVDGGHSSVLFRIRHAGVANFYGRFNTVTGNFAFGDDGGGHIDITVKTESVDSASTGRDNHLKSPDFFNAREHPDITFKSDKIEKADSGYKATGTLTLMGQSKEITVDIEHFGYGEFRGRRTGFETSFTIKRSEFGMNWGIDNGVLGDEVKLIVSLEGIEPREPGQRRQ